MKVVIFGTGRSGTTALYSLMQNIFSDTYGTESYSSIYEPFFWNENVWNQDYEKIYPKWTLVESLSIEGNFYNKKVPIFLNCIDKYKDINYFRKIFSEEKKHLLCKLIRANGRQLLVKHYCPDAKSIFIIRNPLSTINSLLPRFSFYGDDYFSSDYPRFANEVIKVFPDITNDSFKGDGVEKQANYWMYLNKYFLENNSGQCLTICYEDFLINRSYYVRKICDFLDIKFYEKFVKYSSQIVGPTTSNVNLCDSDLHLLEPFFKQYLILLESHGIQFDKSIINETKAKLSTSLSTVPHVNTFRGLTTNALMESLKKSMAEINSLENLVQKKDSEIETANSQINKIMETVNARNSEINEIRSELSRIRTSRSLKFIFWLKRRLMSMKGKKIA